jgi:hypothetical protein
MLVNVGFRPAYWSLGATRDRFDHPVAKRKVNPYDMPGYRIVDKYSLRFQLPLPEGEDRLERVVLLRSSYIGRSPPDDPTSEEGFMHHDNLYFSDMTLLTESFVRTLLQDTLGYWYDKMSSWTIPYIYGHLKAEDSLLGSCDNEEVKQWFNKAIRRYEGGLDRVGDKRTGRGQSLNAQN